MTQVSGHSPDPAAVPFRSAIGEMSAATGRRNLPGILKRFLSWWRNTLKSSLPAALLHRLARPPVAAVLLIRGDGHELRFARERRKADRSPAALSRAEVMVQLARIPRLLRPFRILEIRVRENDCTILENTLPAAARHRACDILQLERQRIGLVDDSRAYAACLVEPMPEARRSVRARLYLTKRSMIDPLLRELAALRFPVHAVTVETDDGKALPLDFLTAEWRRRLPAGFSGWLNRLLTALVIMVVLTGLVAAGLQSWNLWKMNRRLDAMISTAMQQARKMTDKSAHLQRQIDLAARLRTEKKVFPMLVAVINEISRVLPRSAYVEQFRLNENDVQLSGYATSASVLVRALSASPMFDKVDFISPVRVDPNGGREYFALRARFARKK